MAVVAPFTGATYDLAHMNQAVWSLDRGGLFRVAVCPLANGTRIHAKLSTDGGQTWDASATNIPTSGTITGAAVWWGVEWDRQGVIKIWNEDMSVSYRCDEWPTWVAN